jgi:hypothetical protein
MGTHFRRLLEHEEECFEMVADWAKLTPDVMDELLSWTGVRAGNVRMKFRGEPIVSRALRNPVVRGCPVCLREDAMGTEGRASSVMVMRGDWQFRDVTVCVRHGHPLVPMWKVTALRGRFDIGARLREIESGIMSGAFDQLRRTPSDYDLWLDRRLESGIDDTWFSDHPIAVVTTFCRLLGATLMKQKLSDEGEDSCSAQAVGFDVAVKGKAAIRAALDHMAISATGAHDEPSKTFAPLYTQLARDYLHESDFGPFREILRECILNHWPKASGDVVLGHVVAERLLHSLTTAALEIGIGPTVLEYFLVEVGALNKGDNRPNSRRLFDAKANAELLLEISALVGPLAIRTAMGATAQELTVLVDEGLLIPRTKAGEIKKPWRISDGTALVAALSEKAILVKEDDNGWEALLLARKRGGVAMVQLIDGIRDNRLAVGQRVGIAGFHGIVVRKSEVDNMAAPSLALRDAILQEVPGTISAAAFARSIGVRNDGTFLALIEAGHVPAKQIVNPRTGRPQYQMTPEDMAAFHRRFVTFTTLCAETGRHRNTLRGLLAARRIGPFSPEGRDFGAVYPLGDMLGVLG